MRLAQPAMIFLALLLMSGCQTSGSHSDDVTATESEQVTMNNESSDGTTTTQVPTSEKTEPTPASNHACPAQPAPVCKTETKSADNKIVIGEVEKILVSPGDFVTVARIDTGATTTSIHATDVVEFERDGKTWVKFKTLTADGKGLQELKGRVTRRVAIKRHGAEGTTRYAIKLTLTIGRNSQLIEVTLADRTAFDYKVLVGRNLLKDVFSVDVSKKLSAGTPTVSGN